VLSLYRRTLRSATKQSQLSFKERKQIKQQITAEYRKHQHLTDQPFIRQCLVQAENQAKFLESGLGAQNPSIIDDEVDKWERLGGADKNDVLGRVGKGWPWGKRSK